MKKLVAATIAVGLFFASSAIALEPGDTLWTRTYGGDDKDWGEWVQQTTDNGYIIVGSTRSYGAGRTDVYLIKTDANGDTLWTDTYGGLSYESGFSVLQAADGGYLIAGSTSSYGPGYNDVWLVKTDSGGDTLWTRAYGGGNEDDFPHSLEQTADGGYIVTAETFSFGAGWSDVYLLRTDPNGDTLWTRVYGGSEYDWGYYGQQTTDGGYIVAGGTESFGSDGQFYLLKIDSNGDTLWTRTYGGSEYELAFSVQQTTDSGYILAGYTNSYGAGDSDVWLVKTDANGDTLWTRTYGGTGDERAYSVQQTTDGGYILVARTNSFGAGNDDIYLVRTDAGGDTLWTRAYGGRYFDRGYCVQQTIDGGFVVVGETEGFEVYHLYDVWLLRIAGEQAEISIEIVPDDPPVTVPQGGQFGFTGTVTNNTEDPQISDIWVMASGPEKGIYGPFKEFYDIPLAPSQSRSRHLSQRVPNGAPLGFYNYIAYCGDYPSTVMDSSFFQIEVVEGTGSSQGGWVLTGSFLEGDLADIPSQFALSGNYPNPFNASTVISYELPTDSHVRLEVYNISGQKVATLVDGQQEAGYRSVTWEDSQAASGVYFYKLTAEDFTEVKRMTLLR